MSENIQPIRRCTISGHLYGIICPQLGVYDLIPDAEIFAVRSKEKQATANHTGSDSGDSKTVVRTVSEDEIKRLSGESILSGRTDKNGFFCLNDERYQGELLDVYVCLRSVPGPREFLPLKRTTCLFLGTYATRRLPTGWYLNLYIPQTIWCSLKKLVDAWTVAGRVATCEGDHALGNVTVIARDVDCTQDDLLGQAVTNSIGIFRIDYMGDAFRQGTFIDVELFGGPDIYFEVKASDGTSLLTEDRSAGRTIGRCDSGPCKCVKLCVDIGNGNGTDDLPSAWIRVGTAFLLPDSTVALNDFDANGFATAAKYVLTGAPAMRGGVPRTTSGGDPIEYRFLVGNSTAANTAAALPAANFTRIVGAGANIDLFESTLLGDLHRVVSFSPYETESIPIAVLQTDLSADGWLDVNKVIENRFVGLGKDPSTIPTFDWIPNGNMMQINTAKLLPTVPDVPEAVAGPGQPVPVGDRLPVEKMSIRFETRNATTLAALPGNGKTLNSMVINNNASFRKLACKEQLDAGDPCMIVHGVPHMAYTAYHPHLQSVTLHMRSNSWAYNHFLSDPPVGLPLSGNTNPAVVNLNNPNLEVLPHPTAKCAYIVTLTPQTRRHTGGGQVSSEPVDIAIYLEP